MKRPESPCEAYCFLLDEAFRIFLTGFDFTLHYLISPRYIEFDLEIFQNHPLSCMDHDQFLGTKGKSSSCPVTDRLFIRPDFSPGLEAALFLSSSWLLLAGPGAVCYYLRNLPQGPNYPAAVVSVSDSYGPRAGPAVRGESGCALLLPAFLLQQGLERGTCLEEVP